MNREHFKRVIDQVLSSASLRELSTATGIPHSTIALRKQQPLLMPIGTLFRLQDAGLIRLTIEHTAAVRSSVQQKARK